MIGYTLAGEATSVRIWAFYSGEINEPHLAVATVDGEFKEVMLRIANTRTLRTFAKVTQLVGATRTRVCCEADVVANRGESGGRRISLRWTGPMELDRIEIEHRGRE